MSTDLKGLTDTIKFPILVYYWGYGHKYRGKELNNSVRLELT